MPYGIRNIFGPLLYATSVAAAVMSVEVLRHQGHQPNYSTAFIEWTAAILIVSALTDIGLPSAIQWGCLSSNPALNSSRGNAHLSIYLNWILWAVGKPGATTALVCAIAYSIAGLVLVGTIPNHPAISTSELFALAIACSIATNVRKITCAFLEGARNFAASRFLYALPNLLILGYVLANSLRLLEIATFTSLARAVTICQVSSAVIGAFSLIRKEVYTNIPTVTPLRRETGTAGNWHLLSISSAAQGQVFFLLAAKLGIQELTVPIYYAQKAVQVSAEMAAQFIKEWFSKAAATYTNWSNRSITAIAIVSFAPCMAGAVGFSYAQPTLYSAVTALGALVLIEGYASTYFTCKGHIALMKGQPLPVAQHMFGTIAQPVLSLLLIPAIGAAGHYIATLTAGIFFSYRANNTIFARATSENESSAKQRH